MGIGFRRRLADLVLGGIGVVVIALQYLWHCIFTRRRK